ncbi:hypothetical protein COY52_08855 [Candidatus Desantisbacteria bacterium CG_4_10_14_0_8_um_filter_48_22]|uniref:OmpA-like domain-containing protein n=1 Tax=Candidatus Desantisbacteria bacterium CG_4_10_14_0_8_um_filter_48_22 TaxID=1974543 RepID=A0A2M7S8F2_9BACT|nr:MAG: hypothetical protein COY52_08855 [Candidatus Desantisbacteria bacterium CG_4_10_14_0_8_um_filter_48_22]
MLRKRIGGMGDIQIGKSTPAWMLTYSDLITQLLIFFVLFMTLSTLEKTSVKNIILPLIGGKGIQSEKATTSLVPPIVNELQMLDARKQILLYAKEKNLADEIKTRMDQRGLIITLAEKTMFEIGRADILPAAKGPLNTISKILRPLPNDIRIEGHTCNLPIRTAEFPSNWELSAARATNVARYLIEQTGFPPVKTSAAGYGEYHPYAPNNTEENRRMNRRIELVVLWRKLQPLP